MLRQKRQLVKINFSSKGSIPKKNSNHFKNDKNELPQMLIQTLSLNIPGEQRKHYSVSQKN